MSGISDMNVKTELTNVLKFHSNTYSNSVTIKHGNFKIFLQDHRIFDQKAYNDLHLSGMTGTVNEISGSKLTSYFYGNTCAGRIFYKLYFLRIMNQTKWFPRFDYVAMHILNPRISLSKTILDGKIRKKFHYLE